MTAQATARNIRVAPRKARLVVDLIRGKNVVRAMAQLSTLRNRAAEPVMKVLQSAIANADSQDPEADVDNFRVITAYVNEARVLKRFRPRAMGRASGIKKRSSHITLEIGE
ncbi:MAG TPA: 50S ribosomal protein L22 [Candidatus Lambdaproteobacteria bacterium]|jgi:large subunit ribosomal protein L22|nr:50S ribosomal protein L22 [SAR324 cluster bacterium]HBL55010.1 50S ribosomal protein L22 [Deltaproteobacteria bacterium]HHZ77837.1 50S ribosomal protein L22 [Candidatus Lambdaproteobacteria bacterium]HIA56215.1 50S ribosomal protein L22 [Candidatus Lambdaproteobacteria bacterium]HIB44828.1 50S ribosomal protein L22 [Candidatus Lambdaproteobacteria bacterium]